MLFEAFEEAGIKLQENLANFTQYYGSSLNEKKSQELYYHIGQGIRKPTSFLPRREKVQKTIKKQTLKEHTHVMIG